MIRDQRQRALSPLSCQEELLPLRGGQFTRHDAASVRDEGPDGREDAPNPGCVVAGGGHHARAGLGVLFANPINYSRRISYALGLKVFSSRFFDVR